MGQYILYITIHLVNTVVPCSSIIHFPLWFYFHMDWHLAGFLSVVLNFLIAPLTSVVSTFIKNAWKHRKCQDVDATLLSGQVLPDSISVIKHVLLNRKSHFGPKESPPTDLNLHMWSINYINRTNTAGTESHNCYSTCYMSVKDFSTTLQSCVCVCVIQTDRYWGSSAGIFWSFRSPKRLASAHTCARQQSDPISH